MNMSVALGAKREKERGGKTGGAGEAYGWSAERRGKAEKAGEQASSVSRRVGEKTRQRGVKKARRACRRSGMSKK